MSSITSSGQYDRSLVSGQTAVGAQEGESAFFASVAQGASIDTAALLSYMDQKLGIQRQEDGSVTFLDSGPALEAAVVAGAATVAAIEGAAHVMDVMGAVAALPPVSAPPVTLGKLEMEGADSFTVQLNQALDEAFIKGTDANGAPIYKSPSEMSADDLTAIFLKLGVTDPNNDPRVANALAEIAKECRKQALDSERSKLEKQAKELEEAQHKAEKSSKYSKAFNVVSTAVMVVAAVALSVVTFGTAVAVIAALGAIAIGGMIGAMCGGKKGAMLGMQLAATAVTLVCTFGASSLACIASSTSSVGSAAAATNAATQAATALAQGLPQAQALVTQAVQLANVAQAAAATASQVTTWLSIGASAISAGGLVTSGVLRHKAAMAQLEAEELGVSARKSALRAEVAQDEIKELNEIIRLIMESKAAVIEAVMKLLANKQSVSAKVNSIASVR